MAARLRWDIRWAAAVRDWWSRWCMSWSGVEDAMGWQPCVSVWDRVLRQLLKGYNGCANQGQENSRLDWHIHYKVHPKSIKRWNKLVKNGIIVSGSRHYCCVACVERWFYRQ